MGGGLLGFVQGKVCLFMHMLYNVLNINRPPANIINHSALKIKIKM